MQAAQIRLHGPKIELAVGGHRVGHFADRHLAQVPDDLDYLQLGFRQRRQLLRHTSNSLNVQMNVVKKKRIQKMWR